MSRRLSSANVLLEKINDIDAECSEDDQEILDMEIDNTENYDLLETDSNTDENEENISNAITNSITIDIMALAPAHFLVGRPLTRLPEDIYTEIPINRLSSGNVIAKDAVVILIEKVSSQSTTPMEILPDTMETYYTLESYHNETNY
ncbi:hypothetical protein M0802_013035 [Mischocyttarus mexicanus]|nr:hypothetical protein M0802_013035 [Mischocyttarus mexicanus]